MGLSGWLTIVNGTPYTMKTVDKHQYQMIKGGYPESMAPFSAHHVLFEFDSGITMTDADSESWVDYALEGTSRKYRIWLNRRHGATYKLLLAGLGLWLQDQEIELKFQRAESHRYLYNGTVAVISGKDGAFAASSPGTMGSWMYGSSDYLNERTLRQICLPGSHNSGMYKNTGHGKLPTPATAVLCQAGSIWDQLRWGIRYFDIRPIASRNHGCHTGHFTPPWGATGQSIHDIVNNVNDFTYNNAELVILYISHDMNLDNNLASFGQAEWDGLFLELDRLTHRFSASPGQDLTQLKLKEFTGNAKAAVLVVFDLDRGTQLGAREGQGYFYRDDLPLYDRYANRMEPHKVIEDQVQKLRDNRKNPDEKMFVLGWAVTPQDAGDIMQNLVEIGHQGMNPRLGGDLFFDGSNSKVYPNILSMDGVRDTMGAAIAMAINARADP